MLIYTIWLFHSIWPQISLIFFSLYFILLLLLLLFLVTLVFLFKPGFLEIPPMSAYLIRSCSNTLSQYSFYSLPTDLRLNWGVYSNFRKFASQPWLSLSPSLSCVSSQHVYKPHLHPGTCRTLGLVVSGSFERACSVARVCILPDQGYVADYPCPIRTSYSLVSFKIFWLECGFVALSSVISLD